MCIWGAGAAGLLAKRLLHRLGIEPSLFVDSDPARYGATHAGVPVVSPAGLAGLRFAGPGVGVVVASVGRDAIQRALNEAGWRENVDYVVVPPTLLGWLAHEDGQTERAAGGR